MRQESEGYMWKKNDRDAIRDKKVTKNRRKGLFMFGDGFFLEYEMS